MLKKNPVDCWSHPNQEVINQYHCSNQHCRAQKKGKSNHNEQPHKHFKEDPNCNSQPKYEYPAHFKASASKCGLMVLLQLKDWLWMFGNSSDLLTIWIARLTAQHFNIFRRFFPNNEDHSIYHKIDSSYLLTCSWSFSESELVYLHIGQVKASPFPSVSSAFIPNRLQPPVGRRRGRLRRPLRLGEPGPVSGLGELLPGRGEPFPVL